MTAMTAMTAMTPEELAAHRLANIVSAIAIHAELCPNHREQWYNDIKAEDVLATKEAGKNGYDTSISTTAALRR